VQAQAADLGLQKEAPQQTDNDTADGTVSEVQPVIPEVGASETKQETADLTSSQFKDRSRMSQTEEKTQVQTESTMAENGAPVAVESPRIRQAEVPKYETVTTVHVEQPEELPEKVTNQLLSKLAEGVKEFEIHIEPANLGKLAIKVLYEGSQATISIVCSEKRALDVLGQNAREIGNIIERNLGEETTIIVEKQETDYLNQTRDENEQAGQEQQKQKENGKNQDNEDAGDFLQKLRLGLTG
jgi:flagellar hook-length control protein FliK